MQICSGFKLHNLITFKTYLSCEYNNSGLVEEVVFIHRGE